MIIKYNPLEILTSECPKMPPRDKANGIVYVELDDCRICPHQKEIDFDRMLVGCGELLNKTLVDFEVSSSEEALVSQ